jgi:hypothetical protein
MGLPEHAPSTAAAKTAAHTQALLLQRQTEARTPTQCLNSPPLALASAKDQSLPSTTTGDGQLQGDEGAESRTGQTAAAAGWEQERRRLSTVTVGVSIDDGRGGGAWRGRKMLHDMSAAAETSTARAPGPNSHSHSRPSLFSQWRVSQRIGGAAR